MIRKRSCSYGALVVLAVCLLQSPSALQATSWTGLGFDGLWANPTNWSDGVPTETSEWVGLAPAYTSEATIVTGEVEYVGTLVNGVISQELGFTLDVHGELHYGFFFTSVQSDPTYPNLINMYGNSSLSGEGLGLGDNWWWHGGPYVDMNMNDSAYAAINWLWWGGHLNLYGGTMDIAGGVTAETADAVSDATRLIDIYDGKLILPCEFTNVVILDWIERDIIRGFGGAGRIVIDTEMNPGRTTVYAVVPEPTPLALLVLGGLTAVFRRRR